MVLINGIQFFNREFKNEKKQKAKQNYLLRQGYEPRFFQQIMYYLDEFLSNILQYFGLIDKI